VHIQYDDYVVLCPHLRFPTAITTHYGYLGRPQLIGGYWQKLAYFPMIQPNIFALSQEIATFYSNLGIPKEKIFVTPNGVNAENFKITDYPEHSDKSLYLAKIVDRKRQHMFQDISSLYYAGNIEDGRFDTTKNYLGEWEHQYKLDHLTDYANVVLLSDGENGTPLCIKEGMMAGVCVVSSKWAAHELPNEPYITVIDDDHWNDIDYVSRAIDENRKISVQMRKEIREYAVNTFSWESLVKLYEKNITELI
jgi:glycosyltransferase involved in cell wall biosynthesis